MIRVLYVGFLYVVILVYTIVAIYAALKLLVIFIQVLISVLEWVHESDVYQRWLSRRRGEK